jgi:MoaE-MoaD fusion protein
MMVRILFFASLRERVGSRQAAVHIPQAITVKQFKEIIKKEFPVLNELVETSLISINREYAFDEDVIPDGAEIAIFPPVSGGGEDRSSLIEPTFFFITEEELDFEALIQQISLPSSGAVCIFTGLVRAVTRRGITHETEFLDYEAYQPMAEAKMRQVADEIRHQWPEVEGIAMVQRIGRLYPGTPTIVIACSAAHRDTGIFEAARYGIDRLKEIVPIWKRETGPHGEVWVEGEYHPGKGDRP